MQAPLAILDDRPVLGVSMAGLQVLRLDQQGGLASGNKLFKLRENLRAAREQDIHRLVSFGGPWSNHLHALAAIGCEQGLETVGIVRGGAGPGYTAMLADAKRWGMRLVNVSRTEYRRRNNPDYLESLVQRFTPCLLIPEGGANSLGARGCIAIGEALRAELGPAATVVLAVGTGTTLAGVAAGLGPGHSVIGISALKGASDLEDRVTTSLDFCPVEQPAQWSILHHDHCGGFARVNEGLREFILEFEAAHGIPLDPVYTAKALFAIHRRLATGEWSTGHPLVMIHTGGLQGRRGFPFLAGAADPA